MMRGYGDLSQMTKEPRTNASTAESGSLLHAVNWPNAGDDEEAILYKLPSLQAPKALLPLGVACSCLPGPAALRHWPERRLVHSERAAASIHHCQQPGDSHRPRACPCLHRPSAAAMDMSHLARRAWRSWASPFAASSV